MRRLIIFLIHATTALSYAPAGPVSLSKRRPATSLGSSSDSVDAPGATRRSAASSAQSRLGRREAVVAAAAGAFGLSRALLGSPAPSSAATAGVPKTVLVTGCNGGIGFDAAARMALEGSDVILACRTVRKAEDAARRIREMASDRGVNAGELLPYECDLSSLRSVENFANDIKKKDPFIDSVCLNAGIARDVSAKEVLRTKEGFELTVGTNHLGHFYLNHLVLPMIKPKGRIVVTASGVHDPESPGGKQGSLATLGNLSGLRNGPMFDMVDGGTFDPDKAYKDSKLCNVFFTRELQHRLDKLDTGITATCFNPGLIVGTGLFRDQNPVFTKIFDVAATNLLKVGETVHWGGGALEYMALGGDPQKGMYYSSPPGSSKYGDAAYGNQFRPMDVSKEASDTEKGRVLWDLSAKLVGIES